MPFGWKRRSDISRIYGKQGRMLGGPFGGETIERAFCVVLLISDHPADADDEVIQTFRGSPEIADADAGIVKIRMKNGREHAALRRAARIP